MSTQQLSDAEKQRAIDEFPGVASSAKTASANIAAATSVADIKTEICTIWSKIRKYVILAEALPVAGQYIKLLADLLDDICPQA